MTEWLAGKTALIAGAAQRIGKANEAFGLVEMLQAMKGKGSRNILLMSCRFLPPTMRAGSPVRR
nr:hypothetical protein [Mesorhizobium temperatum]